MKSRKLKWIISFLAVLLLLPVGLYWMADAWLESSGGRHLLEQELSARFGMSVRLRGEFDLMLLPDIGVSGTDLFIGGEENPDLAFASSDEFEVSIALKPLYQRQVVLDWIRLTGGRVYPDRYSRIDDTTGSQSGTATSQLPEIRELTLRDFQIVLDEGEAVSLRLESLRVTDFAEGRETEFSVLVENLVKAEGWMRWDTSRSTLQFGELVFDMAGQALSGEACLLLRKPPVLSVELEARTFDIDVFRENLPELGGSGTAEGDRELPLDIRALIKVDELRSTGATARGVVLKLGAEPVEMAVCGSD